jgi:cyclophilin family peptidyl-prolyl cis-trans isomerase
MPAQEGEKPQAKDSAANAAAKASKDDAMTAKDIAIVALDEFIAKQNVDKKSPNWKTTLKMPPKQKFDDKSDYFWHIETTVGALKIQFYPDTAPMHVTNGIYLSRLGFYDGIKFHRIIKTFMAQGGCPLGTGSGSPGYQFAGEFTGGRKHDKAGVLSTANAGPNTDGSQFFITFGKRDSLDGGYTIWGQVVEGLDNTVKAIEETGTVGEGRPTNPPSIVRTWVSVAAKANSEEKPKDAEKPKEGGK